MSKKAKRSAGQTQVSISLEEDLVRQIDEAAAAEHRTRSNFVVHVIRDYLERVGATRPQSPYPAHRDQISLAADETGPEYRVKKKKPA